jgi:tRNA/rRNA methyltransferase
VAKARITACGGDVLINQVKIFSDICSALADVEDVVGFSARGGRNRTIHCNLPEWLARERKSGAGKVALLFGPEDNGLRQEHVEQCRLLITIPTSVENSSFNLAQAVLIVLYELSKQRLTGEEEQPPESPTWNDFYQLDRMVDGIGERSGFFRKGTPQPIPGIIKGLFRRTRPTKREMGVFLGFFGRVERCLTRIIHE